jgi:DNA-binding CsgD family transcriptional regulator
MLNGNFLQLQVSYFGFEKKIQQRLELCLHKNESLQKNSCFSNTISKNPNSSEISIHIYFFTEPVYINKQMFEDSKAANARVLCIGDFNDFANLLSCVQTGSFACISIMNMLDEIIPAIQSVLQNKVYISPCLAPVVNSYFKSSKDHYSHLFTSRENALIQLLTKGALYKEIAWKMRISENTVRSHVRNIYSKLKVHSKTELTQRILTASSPLHLFYFLSDYIACLCY